MKILALLLFCFALPAQQLMIEAEYTSDTVRSYERIGDKHVFRCDGHRWTMQDVAWPVMTGTPKTALLLNEQGTFGCSLTSAGGYTCYVFTPRLDFLETLKSGQQCIKGQLEKPAAAVRITPGTFTFEAPLQDDLIKIEPVRDKVCMWIGGNLYECEDLPITNSSEYLIPITNWELQ